jgi:hypothetical protein
VDTLQARLSLRRSCRAEFLQRSDHKSGRIDMNFAVDDFDVTGHRRFCGVDDSHDSDMADRTVDGCL